MDNLSLNKGRLHLNRKGTDLLCKNFGKSVKVSWAAHDKVVYRKDISGLSSTSDIDKLKEIWVNNQKIFFYLFKN